MILRRGLQSKISQLARQLINDIRWLRESYLAQRRPFGLLLQLWLRYLEFSWHDQPSVRDSNICFNYILLVSAYIIMYYHLILRTLPWYCRYEAVSDTSIKIYPFLSKLQIPFFVIMLVIIAVDLIVSLLGYFNGIDTGALTIVYIIISTAFVIFYFVTVGKITKRLKNSQATGRRIKHLSSVRCKCSDLLVYFI